MCPLTCCTEKDTTLLLWYIPSQNASSESNYEETYEPKLKGILKNNWPVLFKTVKVMEEKD